LFYIIIYVASWATLPVWLQNNMSRVKNLFSLIEKKDFGFTEIEKKATIMRLQGKKDKGTLISSDSYLQKIENLFTEAGMGLEVIAARHGQHITQTGNKEVSLKAIRLAYEMLGFVSAKGGTVKKDAPKQQQINIFQNKTSEEIKKEIARLTT